MSLVRQWFTKAIHQIRNLNLFQSIESLTNNHLRQEEIIITRFYILSTAVCLCGVILFTSLLQQKVTLTISQPSITIYEKLQAIESSLVCPCSRLSIPYSNFVILTKPTVHEACSSPLVNQTWISDVFGETTVNRSVPRAILSSHFRLLRGFCSLSQQIIRDAQLNFDSSELISVSLLSRLQLIEQINSAFLEFRDQLPKVFQHTLSFILDTSLANQIVPIYETNWHLVLILGQYITMVPRTYGRFAS